MGSTVCVRKNHYDTLGLKPTASDEEIREAFARAMRSPHLAPEVTLIGIAFGTLCDPAKRRAYDAALGFIPEPPSMAAPSTISLQISGHFGGLTSATLSQPEPALAPPVRELPIRRISDPEAAVKGSMASHEAASPQLPIPDFLARPSTLSRPARVTQRAVDWKYPVFALGSVILAAALIGAWAGAHAQDVPPASPGSTFTAALPPPKERPVVLKAPAPATSVAEPEFISPEVIERARRRNRARAAAHRIAESGTASQSTAGEGAAAIGEHPDALPAKLPLPSAVIVRTIERIGYSCGAIASARAVDEAGAYKVTCTSGESYQAKPVQGRYHFRRW